MCHDHEGKYEEIIDKNYHKSRVHSQKKTLPEVKRGKRTEKLSYFFFYITCQFL